MTLIRRAAVLAVALTLGGGAVAFDQREVGPGHLPPIARDYREQIVSWSRFFFAEPSAVRGAMVTDPVLVRDGKGRLMWLVCLQAENGAPYVRQPQPERYAFGFAPHYFSAPNERRQSTLTREDCDAPTLAWRPLRTAHAKRR